MAFILGSLIDSLRPPGWDVPQEDPVKTRSRRYGGQDDLVTYPWPARLQMRAKDGTERGDGSLYDMMYTERELIIVSRKARDLIEQVEPDVHDFPPVALLDREGVPIDAAFFWLDIGQSFDACSRAASKPLQWYGLEYSKRARAPVAQLGLYGHVLSAQKIAGRHLWAGNIVDQRHVFFSNDLLHTLQAELRLDLYVKDAPEIDATWSIEGDLPELLEYVTRNPEAEAATLTEEWRR